jgi:hypothetical protein
MLMTAMIPSAPGNDVEWGQPLVPTSQHVDPVDADDLIHPGSISSLIMRLNDNALHSSVWSETNELEFATCEDNSDS